MSGLVKAKKYDWKDSNMALFGSDTEKQVKKESAESEPAWHGAGQKVEVKIWRIVKFKVTNWAPEEYGSFYEGDSYIILNTYKKDPKGEALDHDVHFWIGKYSTQDEYGTAAYKTVELDTFLDDVPVQHREVQGHESTLFKSYFPAMTMLKGGADTGFRHVTPEEYKHRLLSFTSKNRKVQVKEVPLKRSKLSSGDVFILDAGLVIYQWNGSESSKDERYQAAQYLSKLKGERGGKAKVEIVDEADGDDMYKLLDVGDDDEDDEDEDEPDEAGNLELYRLSDTSGSMETELVKEGDITIQDFDSNDVFFLNTGLELFVWLGNRASQDEKKNGLTHAHNMLQNSSHPLIPVSVLKENQHSKAFASAVGLAA